MSQLAFVAIAWGIKVVVDDITAGDRRAAAVAATLLAGGTLMTIAAGFASYVVRMGMVERTTLTADVELASLVGAIPGIGHLEQPEQLDRLELLRNEHRLLAMLPDVVVLASTTLIRLIATVVVLVHIEALLAVLVPLALPSVAASWRAQKRYASAHDTVAPSWRAQGTMLRMAGTEASARELRVFGAGDGLLRHFDESISTSNSVLARAGARGAVEQTLGWMLFGAAFAFSLATVARRAVDGGATAGDLVLALTLGSQLTSQLAGFVSMISAFANALRTAERYGWLVRQATTASKGASEQAEAPARLTEGIRLQRVSFVYPGTDRPVLEDVDVLLPAGATVAIVGNNGAGKTTLVKLLTRMYEPTAGQILVDGTPLAAIEPATWRSRVSAAFQDHAKLELVAQHVVGVGLLPKVDDRSAVTAALSAANATDVLDALPDGMDTQLGRQFDDGTELSGGQWQKLAVARSMMRDEPVLLVLDEPTAALDALTEARLFERYAAAANRVRSSSGGITLIVSHRFSTVRMADLILVVDSGRIAEAGTHESLMSLGGLYAELFDLQSQSYR